MNRERHVVLSRFTASFAAAVLLSSACSPSSGSAAPAPLSSVVPDASVPVHPPSTDAGLLRDAGFFAPEPDGAVFDPGKGGVRPGATNSKIDLLFVVDDSISMADKHEILKAAVPDLLGRLANPVCLAPSGTTSQPTDPSAACPVGMSRQFQPVRDIHIGIVTSSLGSPATSSPVCGVNIGDQGNDGAHLVGTLPRGKSVPTYADKGFLAWDPDQKATPPGEKDLNALIASFTSMIGVVGEQGCGFEASLEAWYRFLVDPEPPLTIQSSCGNGPSGCAVPTGLDQAVLDQRVAFLRPDSLLVVAMLTDENDCSTSPAGGLLLHSSTVLLPRSSMACATNPDDPCCRSCATTAPAGCLTPDPACTPQTTTGDELNLRCFEPKRRFGLDALYPVQRYIDGLTKPTITNRAGSSVPNPVFAGGTRTVADVFLIGIVGVPWQDVATPATLTSADQLRLLSTQELTTAAQWNVLLGDRAHGVLPTDALMIESVDPRTGKNPIIDAPLAPPTAGYLANPINGHETIVTEDLQHACIFPLPAPKDCASSLTGACDCMSPTDGTNDPLCQNASGAYTTRQGFAKGYPAPRIIQVIRGVGDRGVLASICPKNASDSTREDYGYRPVIGATISDVAPVLLK